ncbi:MAG TPA: YXWGXW repeat-containing protein [Phycisphaerae bacterium]
MKGHHVSKLCAFMGLVALCAGFGWNKAMAVQRSQADDEDGVQVLTRGPVHEAFAETVTFDPDPGIAVKHGPPDPIEEIAPDQRPEGRNVTWIPGYWAWDDERNDFLWVSGIWRALPPGRQWVCGYWGKSRQGFQWTSGYWADAQASEIEYLPEPPETVETGPNVDAPSADYTWIPGCWVWYDGRYAWRSGYWERVQPNWVWVPDHYVWAPRGYVFVEGYWDYAVGRRGVLFAPVYFDARVRARPSFSYSPATVIDLAVFTDHLFVRPRYQHYYFGDYYAPSYQDAGIYASFSFHNDNSYDPIYAQQRWQHRSDRDWAQRVLTDFTNRRDHEEARPPRTLAIQIALSARNARSNEKSLVLATALERLATSQDSPLRFKSVDPDERKQFTQRRQEVQRFREERQTLETTAADRSAQDSPRGDGPARVKFRKSPIAANAGAELGTDDAPPTRRAAPRPDPKVERKQKKAAEKRDHREKP